MADYYLKIKENEKNSSMYFFDEVGIMVTNIITGLYERYFIIIKDLEFILINKNGKRYIIDINPICNIEVKSAKGTMDDPWVETTCTVNKYYSFGLNGNMSSVNKIKSRFKFINKLDSIDLQRISTQYTYRSIDIRTKSSIVDDTNKKENIIRNIKEQYNVLNIDKSFNKLLKNFMLKIDKSEFWTLSNKNGIVITIEQYITSKIELIPDLIIDIQEEVGTLEDFEIDDCIETIGLHTCFDKYKKMLVLLKKRMYISNYFEGIYVFWHLYRQRCIEFKANEFKTAYGYSFENNISQDLNKMVMEFVQLPFVNPRNQESVFEFVAYLINSKIIIDVQFHDLFFKINKIIPKIIEEIDIERFEKELMDYDKYSRKISIDDIDLMTGLEFEQFVERLFNKMGFKTKITKKVGIKV